MIGCAVSALLRQLHTVFGIQIHSKIDSSARPLASSLAVIYVQLMLQGSMGCGSACNDVQKQLKAAGLRTPMATMHAMHSSIFILAPIRARMRAPGRVRTLSRVGPAACEGQGAVARVARGRAAVAHELSAVA